MIKQLPNTILEKFITIDFMWSYIKVYQKEISEIGIKLKYNKIQSLLLRTLLDNIPRIPPNTPPTIPMIIIL